MSFFLLHHTTPPFHSIPIGPRPPQPRAASFKSLYRKRASTPRSCIPLAASRFRYSTRTYQELASDRHGCTFLLLCTKDLSLN